MQLTNILFKRETWRQEGWCQVEEGVTMDNLTVCEEEVDVECTEPTIVDEPETTEPVVPEPLVCEEGKVPGWLDDTGEPTACVDDSPTVEVDPVLEYNHWVDCANDMVYFELGYWEGEVWVPDTAMEPVPASLDELYYAGCHQNIVVDEPAVLEEVVEMVEVPVVPEAVDTGALELAETGAGEVITGALLGVALVIAGVFIMMKGKKSWSR